MGSSYKIDAFNVLYFENEIQRKWYIRAILDVTSCEFELSELTNEKRIDIVNVLGLEKLQSVLDACYKELHPEYSAADEVMLFIKTVGLYSQGKVTITEQDKLTLKLEALQRKSMRSFRG